MKPCPFISAEEPRQRILLQRKTAKKKKIIKNIGGRRLEDARNVKGSKENGRGSYSERYAKKHL